MSTGLLLLGRLAIRLHFLTEERLVEALQLQKKHKSEGENMPFGELLLRHKFLTKSQLTEIISAQRMINQRSKDRCFGEVAIANGMITEEQLHTVLAAQVDSFQTSHEVDPVGGILLEQGILTTDQCHAIAVALERIQKTPISNGQPVDATEVDPITIERSSDNLTAMLYSTGELSGTDGLEQVKKLVKKQRIKHGLVEEEKVLAFLENPDKHGLILAQGTQAKAGKDAVISYDFEANPLRSGAVAKDGSIDFKNRGDIPQVNEGTVIAVKTPRVDGTAGLDILGHKIPPPEIKDCKLIGGTGVKVAADRMSATAKTSGTPTLTKAGALTILPVFKIKGSIGYKSGHINFQGDIKVSEGVDDGFKVNGGRLDVKEIGAAEINISGDVVVRGGIINAQMKVGGNLKANYIHKSHIEVAGDVIIKKEIMESELIIGENLIIDQGDILSTTIKIQGDVTTNDVGSPAGVVSNLKLGSCAQIDLDIQARHDLINQLDQEKEDLQQEIAQGAAEHNDATTMIGSMAQIQDRGQVELRELTARIEQNKGKPVPKQINEKIAQLKHLIANSEENLNKFFDKQDKIDADRPIKEQRQLEIDQEIENIDAEIDNLKQQKSAAKEKNPRLNVKGTLFPQNIIGFPHLVTEIKTMVKRSQLHEIGSLDKNNIMKWKVAISSLDSKKKKKKKKKK
jgi:uncharacterized protein